MKKLKNKFIIGIIVTIFVIISFQVFVAYSNNQRDTNSYVTNLKGSVVLNEVLLPQEGKERLTSGDKISVGEESLALIEWGDGSLTRLGENTKISVDETQVSQDYTIINISFELISGKTWSNVVSFLGNESYFTQSFQGIEAGVRGTVFNVDLEKDYMQVTDHQVTLTNTQGEMLVVEEGKPVKLSGWSFLDIQEFIANLQDISWENLNIEYDEVYINSLTLELKKSLKTNTYFLFFLDFLSPKYKILATLDTADQYSEIERLLEEIPSKKLPEVYKAVYTRYQDFNFIQIKNYEFYKRKIFYKKTLLFLSPYEEEKQSLIQSSVFDLGNIIESQAQEGLQETLQILVEHKEILETVNTQILQTALDIFPKDLFETFSDELESIKNIFESQKNSLELPNISLKDIKNQAQEKIKNTFEGQTQDILDIFQK